ncbi:alpha/beta hydrolase fold domain-containing protein [Microbacterium luticocti]|uniref:alpha/beta hydrolase fold domain-containing protein n=1 Tax=Microbacterium luticocti TaxID=451764 RepID=UPI000413EBF4|nr:alpha/beta hydrolase fold domain-containing protein [Microbacterium luticocti]
MPTLSDLIVGVLAWRFARSGEPADPRPDVDTASLQRRFPHLAAVQVEDVAVTGPHGPVPARLYRVPDATATAAFVWVHGGAFVGGTLDMPESNWVGLEFAAAGIPTLAVDYRKALRGVRYPVPGDDVRAAWDHATSHARELFGTDAAAMHLGGASAGGAIVAGLALRLRDEGARLPASLVLAYPMLHPDLPPNTPETLKLMAKMPARLRFRPGLVHALAKHYAGRRGLRDPYAFAGVATDLHGLPPTYILVAMIDDLRSSGDRFAQQLRSAGVRVELFAERSATHGHLNHPEAASARRSLTRIREWIDGFS